jgi:hypothetical protein
VKHLHYSHDEVRAKLVHFLGTSGAILDVTMNSNESSFVDDEESLEAGIFYEVPMSHDHVVGGS